MLFMNSSLDKVVKNLNDFKYLSSFFSGEQLDLVKKEGIYPYEYMNNFERFKKDLNIFFWAYNFIINKITRDLITTK